MRKHRLPRLRPCVPDRRPSRPLLLVVSRSLVSRGFLALSPMGVADASTPWRLQSLCRSLSLEGLAQYEEVSGGQVPRGYPRQEVPAGSGDISGICLTTDIRTPSYQPRNRPVCSTTLTILAAIGSGTNGHAFQKQVFSQHSKSEIGALKTRDLAASKF